MAEYIKRETLRKTLETWRDAHADVDDEDGWGLLEDVLRELNAQATADVAPVVHGTWTDAFEGLPKHAPYGWACSVCGGIAFNADHSYCPNCGAKMDGDSDG